MKITSYFTLVGICFAFGAWAGTPVYILNNSSETVSVKGPIKSTNKAAVPVTLKPGEVITKDAALEGRSSDTLEVTLLGHTTQAIQRYSRKFSKPTALIYVNENEPERVGPGFDLWQTDGFSAASVTTPTSF